MNSNNGDLYFRAGIDLDGFNAGAAAMEQRMKSLTSTVVSTSGEMDNALSRVGDIFTRMVGVGAAAGFVKEMFNVRSEMQNTEAALKVFLGSAEEADKFFRSLQDYAYNNVFEFKDLAQQSAQLLAYRTNVEDVIPTLNKLSEIAAATNAPLNELVRVFNKVKSTNRLDADAIESLGGKGIDVRKEIAEIRGFSAEMSEQIDVTGLKFSDLQTIIDHVAGEGGRYFGMMEEKMKTLGDTWGLMQDNITNMFNEIGKENQELLKAGMDVGNYLIENYKGVAKVLGALVVAYGSAKAARVALNVAQKNGTGIAVLDNTVWGIRANLMKKEVASNINVTKSIRDIKKAQEEEIATLKLAITEQEHEAIINKSRIANLGEILTQQQKMELAQMGLTEASDEYLPIATSMLSREQAMTMAKSELTKNNQSYINAMREVIGLSSDETKTIDDRIKATVKDLSTTEDLIETSISKKEKLEENIEALKESYKVALNNADASDIQAKAEALENAQTELQAVSKNIESLAETRNTTQKKLNELQTRKNTLATTSDTVATNINTKSKNLSSIAIGKLTSGLKMLWAVMKANPIMSIVSIATTLYSVITSLSSKTEEATMGLGKASKEAAKTFNEENSKIEVLTGLINDNNISIETRKKKLAELKEIVPDYHADLTDEGILINNNTGAIDNYCKALEKQIRLQAYEKELTELTQNKIEAQENIKKKQEEYDKRVNWQEANSKVQYYGLGGAGVKSSDARDVVRAKKELEEAKKEFSKIEEEIVKIKEKIGSDEAIKKEEEKTKTALTVAEKRKQLLAEIANTEKALNKARSSNSEYDKEEIARLEKELKNKQAELGSLVGKDVKKSTSDIQKAKSALTEAELQLEIERQEAIIATMKEGVEKQQAIIELNYKKQMQSISKTKEEYDRKRKEAGLNGNSADIEVFRIQENKAKIERDKAESKLFENEIENHKQEYEEYLKWTNAVSKEAADKKFADLIAQGNTFADWVNTQIKRLEDKGSLSSSETSFLEDLRKEAESANADSYKKLFADLQSEIDKAPALAKKLELLVKAIEKLKGNGDNSNAKSELLLNLATMVADTQEEIDKAFEDKYKSYSKRRVELEQSYLADIKKLTQKGMKIEAGNLSRELKEAIEALNTDFVKSIVSESLANPTKSNIKSAIEELDEISTMNLDVFNRAYNLDLTKEQLKGIKEAICDVRIEIKKLGEGYTLSDAFKDIRDGRIEEDLEKVARGTNYIQNAFSKLSEVTSVLSSALDDLSEVSDNKSLKNLSNVASDVSDVLGTAGSFASTGASFGGVWGAVIGAVIGGGLGIITKVLESEKEKEEQIAEAAEKGLEHQQDVMNKLGEILGSIESLSDTITSLSYDQFSSSLLSLIQELKESSEAISKRNENGDEYWHSIYNSLLGSDIAKVFSSMIEEGVIDKETAKKIRRESWVSSSGSTGMYDNDKLAKEMANYLNWKAQEFSREQKNLILELQDLYNSGTYDSLKYFNATNKVYQSQIEWLEHQRDLMKALGQDTSEIDRQIAEMELSINKSLQNIAESLYGVDMDGIISEWISIFEQFGDNVDGAFNAIDESIDRMIANMLQKRLVIEPLMEQFTQIFDNYANEVGEGHEYTDEDFVELANRIGDAKDEAYENYERYLGALNNLGIDLANMADSSTLAGSIQNLSEETGGIIAGRLNAMVINQAEGNNYMRQSLLVQYEMKNHLADINQNVASIKSSIGNRVSFNENMNYGISEK